MVDPQHVPDSYALLWTLLLPLVCSAVLFLARSSRRWPGLFATTVVSSTLVLSVVAASAARYTSINISGGEWLPGFGNAWSLQLDWQSSWLLILLEIVGLMVHVFSLGYMREERDQARYFCGLQFFVAAMKLLILAGSYLLLFAGWEGVGLASYLLIGYHFERPLAARAATKAFVVNRIGDAGLLLALIAIALSCASTEYSDVTAAAIRLPHGTVVLIASLLVVGAIGKSAQFPLHIWLPDAMEGPTPVSALIHSATMVCAGVYLLTRSNFLLTLAPEVGETVAILGAVSALFAATVALAENDIKRVLAYSTISQIGFMFVALGIGADRAAMFHVVTHAFFKSLLFLGAGSVIHALHGEQNLKHMGGLRRQMPVTFWSMWIAALTLAGVPGLSAFFSKDLILEAGFESGHGLIATAGVATSLLTALYSWRLMSLAFYGTPRGHQLAIHQPLRTMQVPLVILALCCVLVGWLFVPVHAAAWLTMLVSSAVAFLGIWLAWQLYILHPAVRAMLDNRFAPVTKLLRNRWYVDAIFEEQFVEKVFFRTAHAAALVDASVIDASVRGTALGSRRLGRLSTLFDGGVVDGIVRFFSTGTRYLSWPARALQTGFVQTYCLVLVAGVIAVLGYYLSRR